jgi:hypothetical protein
MIYCAVMPHCVALDGARLPLCCHIELSIRAAHVAFATPLQAEAEERLSLPVTFVKMNDEAAKLKGQLFFVSKIVAPLWDPITLMFPELSHLADNLSDTRAYYEREIARCTASTADVKP